MGKNTYLQGFYCSNELAIKGNRKTLAFKVLSVIIKAGK